MSPTRHRVPAHLRRYVVEQDYDAYDAIDQAVWRFVLTQTYDHLKDVAHPAYARGLEETGIAIDHIPRIEEMDERLAAYGWGAVAVDGFIPPRAFQELQALGIMTIAVSIRQREHTAYTPAPDIIHESAGHAPIVPDARYRAFLQRSGEVGRRAFASPQDRGVYAAIRALSEVKEERGASPKAIAAAQRTLEVVSAEVGPASEAARLARLHWWTVEYGLVATPRAARGVGFDVHDYKLYGAGLLSSLGESRSCVDDDRVRKLPLSLQAVEQGYDITRPQPQLYVARDFAHLDEVLDAFADTLAQRVGGMAALRTMQASGELGTVELAQGLQVTGVLAAVDTWRQSGREAPAYLRLRGPCALAMGGRQLAGHGRARHAEGFGMPVGRLADGAGLWALGDADLQRRVARDGTLALRYASGVEVRGRLAGTLRGDGGRVLVLTLEGCTVRRGDELLFDPSWGPYDLAAGDRVVGCFAGAADNGYYPPGAFSGDRVPRPKEAADTEPGAAGQGSLLTLFERCADAVGRADREAEGDRSTASGESGESGESGNTVGELEALAEAARSRPDAWLLRWNLLEGLGRVRPGVPEAQRARIDRLMGRLVGELLAYERTDYDRLPITTGLRFLGLA